MKKEKIISRLQLWQRLMITLTAAFLWAGQAAAQDTLLLSPTGDGGFENGADFAANGWTVENFTSNNTNKWCVGTPSLPTQGNNAAYISKDNGVSYEYNRYAKSRVLFWRDITFPAGYSNIVLTFKVKVQGLWDGTASTYYDNLFVLFQSGNTAPSVSQPGSTTSQVAMTNATRIATLTELGAGYVARSYVLNAGNATAATTRRLIFYWRNFDNGNGVQPPASIDEISIVASASLPNDNASGAVMLTAGAGCTTFYNNYFSTANTGELTASCRWQAVAKPLWFKFTAPPSGAVRISSDYGGTLTSTRMGLFTAADSSNYSTFNIIHCAGASGITSSGNNIFYPTGLQPGATYYLALDAYDANTSGTFCITVDELDGTMIATGAADCANGKAVVNWGSNNYQGWISLVNNQGKVNMNVRQVVGNNNDFSSSVTTRTGLPRTDVNGQPYLNRNYLVNSSSPTATPLTSADVQFFFTDAELAGLGTALGSLNVSRVPGDTCTADFRGVATLLDQTANGSINGINWVQVNTPGFSNFFIHSGTTPLPVEFADFKAFAANSGNRLTWVMGKTNIKGTFEVMHSADGNKFENISTIASNANSNYSFSHETPGVMEIYRIRFTDVFGKSYYSQPEWVQRSGKGDLAVLLYPNPASSQVDLKVQVMNAGETSAYSITNILGAEVLKGNIETAGSDLTTMQINIGSLSNGIYQFRLTSRNSQVVRRLVIAK